MRIFSSNWFVIYSHIEISFGDLPKTALTHTNLWTLEYLWMHLRHAMKVELKIIWKFQCFIYKSYLYHFYYLTRCCLCRWIWKRSAAKSLSLEKKHSSMDIMWSTESVYRLRPKVEKRRCETSVTKENISPQFVS